MGQIDQSEKLMGDVQESELPVTPPPPRKRSLSQKLGIFNLLVLILGTLLVFAALAILVFVWIVSIEYALNNYYTPKLWDLIVFNNWTTRVITLSSTAIRIATAAHLGIFTAIMAALILEKAGAPRADLPKVSIMRCSNSGPNSLVLSIPSSIFRVSVLPYAFLIVVAVVDAFALQFTSTILLTDFHPAQVVLQNTSGSIPFALHEISLGPDNTFNPYTGINYWLAAPTSYNRFAELREAGSVTTKYTDTGTSYRAFLPFRTTNSQNMLRSYAGPMTIVDTRVICVKPTVSNISFDAWTDEEPFPTFTAMYDWSNTHPDITGAGHFPDVINCSIPTTDVLYNNYWATSLCSYGVAVPPARLAGAIPDPADSTYPYGHGTSVNVLVNATGAGGDWFDLMERNATLEQVESSTAPWTQLQAENITISVSVCFTNPNPGNYKAAANSFTDGNDSTIEWDAHTQRFDTSAVRTMFGVTNTSLTLEQRGLLSLTIPDSWTTDEEENILKVNTTTAIWDALSRSDNQYSDQTGRNVLTTSDFNDRALYGHAIHRTHAAIVQATMQQTMNPALTLQTLWTVLMEMAYYDFLPQFDVSAPVGYTISDLRTIPKWWKGFAVVMGLTGVHFVLVLLAVLMFFGTEISLLGNSWQVIAQVVSTDTADLVHHSATSTDDEAMKYAKTSGFDNEIIRIAKCETSGRAQATAVRRHVD